MLWVLTDACYRGKLKEVIHLLSGDHVDVNEFFKVPRLDVQWTPLTSAAMGGQTTLVKILINRYGARVDNPNTRGMTALTAAAFAGFPESCQILLDHGANIEAPGLRGETALIGAASGGHGTTVDLLMKHGANIEAVDNDGRTALMKAAKFGCTGTVDLLVTRYGADCSVKDKDGMTAQMIAAGEGNDDVATLIGTLSTCPQIFMARKTLDELYKNVEAALDRQLVAETKMDELVRQLCDDDKIMLEKKKETAIQRHMESEDLLVDYQRQLIQAADGSEDEILVLFNEAVEIVQENTAQTEAEMMSFVHLVEDVSAKLDRYGEIKEEVNATKQRFSKVKIAIEGFTDRFDGHIALLSRQSKESGRTAEEIAAFNEQITLLQMLQEWSAGEKARVGLAGGDHEGALRASGPWKEVEECEEDICSATKTKPISGCLSRLEAHLESLKSIEEAVRRLELEFAHPNGDQAMEPKNLVGPPDDADGTNNENTAKDADNTDTAKDAKGAKDANDIKVADNAPADKVCAAVEKDEIGSSSTFSSIDAMDPSQVLGLLEIKLDGETYATRAPRRSHRSWQMTKRSSAERSADLNTAEKIAGLLQKSKMK